MRVVDDITIDIIDDYNGTLTRIIQYLLQKEGHSVRKPNENWNHLIVSLNKEVSKFFD